jgi:ribosomal protein S19
MVVKQAGVFHQLPHGVFLQKENLHEKNMSRSKWKGPVFDEKILYKITLPNVFKDWNKKIVRRNCNLPVVYSEEKVLIYNGKTFKKVFLTKEKVGFKTGMFSNTRKFVKTNIKKYIKKK